MTYHYDDYGCLECTNCGAHEFDLVAEIRIKDVSKNGDDPVANRTIESENIISLVCARCGVQIK